MWHIIELVVFLFLVAHRQMLCWEAAHVKSNLDSLWILQCNRLNMKTEKQSIAVI